MIPLLGYLTQQAKSVLPTKTRSCWPKTCFCAYPMWLFLAVSTRQPHLFAVRSARLVACLLGGVVWMVMASPASSQAQENTEPGDRYAVGLRPLSLTIGGLEAEVEWWYSRERSARFTGGYFSLSEPSGLYRQGILQMRSQRFEAQLHRYLQPDQRGFHYFFYATYRETRLTAEVQTGVISKSEERFVASMAGVGAGAGYAVLIGQRLYCDVWAASGLILPLNNDEDGEVHIPLLLPYRQAWQVRGGLTVGWLLNRRS